MKTPPRPNILFLFAESMDGRWMGSMGHPMMRGATPHLDRLAERGILFRNAYSACPVCNPSRAGMWSGKYPGYYDCWNNNAGLKPGTPTFWDVIEPAGYRAANFGKTDYEHGLHSVRDQVASWTRRAEIERPVNRLRLPLVMDEDLHPGDWQKADQVIAEIRQAAVEDRPFFCCLSTGLVHPAFATTPGYLERIRPETVEIPPGLRDLCAEDHPCDRYRRITKNHARAPAPELVRDIRRVYGAMIAEMDDIVGKILGAVNDLGLADSTVVIFSSDHGEMAAEHSEVLKRTMFEPSIHVPLIVAGPGIRRGAVVDDLVSLIDIYPTLLDLMGLRYEDVIRSEAWPAELDGESLVPQLVGNAPRARDWAMAQYHGDRSLTGTFMLRQDRWKLLHHVGYAPQLFELEADPWELEDLAGAKPDVVERMTARLAAQTDCEATEARARVYNHRSFRAWREAQRSAGTYEQTMAQIYSGFSHICLSDYQPWRKEDEARIEAWLAGPAEG